MSQSPEDKRKILCVGLICIDLVVTASEFPQEDTLTSALRQRWQRGGNAGNDCTVLSFLNCQSECLATFVKDGKSDEDNYYTKFLINDFKKHGIDISNSVYYPGYHCPYSYIIVNSQTGTRTIMHHKSELPELTVEDFKKLNLRDYKWIHFEGRHPDVYSKMMKAIVEWNRDKPTDEIIRISLEMEFLDVNHDSMLPFVDYVFVNKEIAKMKGLLTKEAAISKSWLPVKESAAVIIPWGDEGAVGKQGKETIISKPWPPSRVVDTLGAGDTFLSSTIFCLSKGHDLSSALTFGCRVAGTKCGFEGFQGLRHVACQMYSELFPQETV